jgi:hypothetical protein
VDRSVSDDYRRADVDVDVLIDGEWHFGVLRAWRREGETWLGNVVWNKGPGDNRIDWVPAERLRKVD